MAPAFPVVGCALALVALLALAQGTSAHAQAAADYCAPERQLAYNRAEGSRWLATPAVTVLGRADDPRVELVRDAVAFWNDTLARSGSGFRLGPVAVEPLSPELAAWVPTVSAAVLAGTGAPPPGVPPELDRRCGCILVALADADFISFARFMARRGLVLVGIKGLAHPPLDRPNVARNVIAHELGHAIGMRHNDDPHLLMCGRPASCRPTLFEAADARYFPLGDTERHILSAKYPSTWQAGQSRPGPVSDP